MDSAAATAIQGLFRGKSARDVYRRKREEAHAAVAIQRAGRGYIARKRTKRFRQESGAASIAIQSAWRMHRAKKTVMYLIDRRNSAVIMIQALARSYLAKLEVSRMKEERAQIERISHRIAARRIQTTFRGYSHRNWASTKIGKVAVGFLTRKRVKEHRHWLAEQERLRKEEEAAAQYARELELAAIRAEEELRAKEIAQDEARMKAEKDALAEALTRAKAADANAAKLEEETARLRLEAQQRADAEMKARAEAESARAEADRLARAKEAAEEAAAKAAADAAAEKERQRADEARQKELEDAMRKEGYHTDDAGNEVYVDEHGDVFYKDSDYFYDDHGAYYTDDDGSKVYLPKRSGPGGPGGPGVEDQRAGGLGSMAEAARDGGVMEGDDGEDVEGEGGAKTEEEGAEGDEEDEWVDESVGFHTSRSGKGYYVGSDGEVYEEGADYIVEASGIAMYRDGDGVVRELGRKHKPVPIMMEGEGVVSSATPRAVAAASSAPIRSPEVARPVLDTISDSTRPDLATTLELSKTPGYHSTRDGRKYYVDGDGVTYHLGVDYFEDESGRPYYEDDNGDRVYLEDPPAAETGERKSELRTPRLSSPGVATIEGFHVDKDGRRCYGSEDGSIWYEGVDYTINKAGAAVYRDEDGVIRYLIPSQDPLSRGYHTDADGKEYYMTRDFEKHYRDEDYFMDDHNRAYYVDDDGERVYYSDSDSNLTPAVSSGALADPSSPSTPAASAPADLAVAAAAVVAADVPEFDSPPEAAPLGDATKPPSEDPPVEAAVDAPVEAAAAAPVEAAAAPVEVAADGPAEVAADIPGDALASGGSDNDTKNAGGEDEDAREPVETEAGVDVGIEGVDPEAGEGGVADADLEVHEFAEKYRYQGPPVPAPWKECWDREYGTYYFLNPDTNQAVWEAKEVYEIVGLEWPED